MLPSFQFVTRRRLYQAEFFGKFDFSMNTQLYSSRVLIQNQIRPAAITIGADGRIFEVRTNGLDRLSANVTKLDGLLAPGLVDTHAHINEPGRTEWEGFETATQAALAGGITTVVDMPLNSLPPTLSLEALKIKQNAAAGKTWIDHGFWGGLVPSNADNFDELSKMVDHGVLGFKAFMIDSGVPEFEWSNREVLIRGMRNLSKLGVPLLVHAEVDTPVHSNAASLPHSYAHYLESRPKEFENKAIELIIELSEFTHCPVHVVHLSSADALASIQKAKARGVKITVETCPHYLSLNAETIMAGATEFKCAPPIREESNRQALLKGLRSKIIDFVVSDHSPCTPELKLLEKGDFDKAWGGIASIQLSFSATWTALSEFGFSIEETLSLMTSKTAAFAGLSDRGEIREGAVAHLVEIDPDATFRVTADRILHRHKTTPYLGKTLRGIVKRTWLNGELKFDLQLGQRQIIGPATGKTISRKDPAL